MGNVVIAKNWVHPELGDVEVVSAGHFPDTVMISTLFDGIVECPISELVSETDSNKLLDSLLSGIAPSKG